MTRVTDEDLKKLVAVASNAGESEWRRFMNMHADEPDDTLARDRLDKAIDEAGL